MAAPLRVLLLLMVVSAVAAEGMKPRKLDDVTIPGGNPDDQSKCGGCPCNKPCYSPPPPYPSPPPPSPPLPPKKPPPTPGKYCPPPPSPPSPGGDIIYITGPPGDLYPVVNPITASGHRSFRVAPPLLVVVIGMLGMLGFW